MPVDKLELIIDALNYASAELKELQQDLGDVGGAANEASEGGLAGLKAGWLETTAAIAGFAVTAKKGYDFIKQGATLEMERERFDRLALSIGTNGDALVADLIPAMRGMMSEAEGVSMATQLMSLGLAQSHDEAIRLTRVAAALDMPLNQLVLTLTNMTDMRFDSLNMSVDGFWEKVKKLEATMSKGDAFKMAFLSQAEDQIEKVGDAADTQVGQIQAMESALKDLMDQAKMEVAPIVIPVIIEEVKILKEAGPRRDFTAELKAAYEEGYVTQTEQLQVYDDLTKGVISLEEAMAWLEVKILNVDSATSYADAALLQYAIRAREASMVQEELAERIMLTAAAREREAKVFGVGEGYKHWSEYADMGKQMAPVEIPARLKFEGGMENMGLFLDVPMWQQGDNLLQSYNDHILKMMQLSYDTGKGFDTWSDFLGQFNPEMSQAMDTGYAWANLVAVGDQALLSGAVSAEQLDGYMKSMFDSIGPTGDAAVLVNEAISGLPIPLGQMERSLVVANQALQDGAGGVEALKAGMRDLNLSDEDWMGAVTHVQEGLQAGVESLDAIKETTDLINADIEAWEATGPAEFAAEDEATEIIEPLVEMAREWDGVHTAYFVAKDGGGGGNNGEYTYWDNYTGGDEDEGPGFASAMDSPILFNVPPNFPNDSFRARFQTGETVAAWNASDPNPFGIDISPLAGEITALRRDLSRMPGDIARAVRDAMLMSV